MTLFSPTPVFKSLPNRRIQRIHRPQQKPNTNNIKDLEPITNISPPIITMPNLMEFTRRLSRSSSIIDSEMTIIDTQIDLKKQETPPVLRTKIPIVNNNNKRTISQKNPNNVVQQQPFDSIESVLKERSINLIQDDSNEQSNRIRRVNQIFKRQIFLPFDKK